MTSILVIDDDRSVLHLVRQIFKEADLTVLTAGSAEEGLEVIAAKHPDVALIDIMLGESSGLRMFQRFRELDARLPVIFITAGGTSDTAIEAMQAGAYDYILKPLDATALRELVQHALNTRLVHVPVRLPDMRDEDDSADLLVGRSPQMLEVYKAVGRVALQDVTVLIRGESGTGKELIARAVYQHSARKAGPFLAVNCAAIPDSLLESELFGHEKGSFTSADRRRIGKFEQCTGGTIFLDEVGDMSPLVQGKLLRILQDQTFERVGGNETIRTDVRIITATNRHLEQMVEAGTFRSDLYYRLNGFAIDLPPLRERGDDILLILERFLGRFARELNKDVQGISPEALKLLTEYSWPGNVRELQSVLKKSLLYATGPVLTAESLPEEIRAGSVKSHANGGNGAELDHFIESRIRAKSTNLYAESIELLERRLLASVLRANQGRQTRAAEMLGITRGSLRKKIRTLGITIDPQVNVEDGTPADEPAAS